LFRIKKKKNKSKKIMNSKNYQLNQNQKDLIIGTLLGDSTMGLAGGKPKYSLKFEQAIVRKDYIWHIYEKIADLVGTGPKVRYKSGTSIGKSVWFRTYRHSCLQPYLINLVFHFIL